MKGVILQSNEYSIFIEIFLSSSTMLVSRNNLNLLLADNHPEVWQDNEKQSCPLIT